MRIEPAAHFIRRDPEGGGHRVRKRGGGLLDNRPHAEKQGGRSCAGGRELAQPCAVHRPDKVVAIVIERPILARHRLADSIGQHHPAQRDAGRGLLHRFRCAVAALETPAVFIRRKGQRLRPPIMHFPKPGRAFGREQRMGFQRAIRTAQRQ